MILWKKEKEIQRAIEEYLLETENCLEAFGQAFEVYFAEGLSDNFQQQIDKTHAHESKADDERREIEYAMYDRALIPESRGWNPRIPGPGTQQMRIGPLSDLVPEHVHSRPIHRAVEKTGAG